MFMLIYKSCCCW